jgi:hypothetical protein
VGGCIHTLPPALIKAGENVVFSESASHGRGVKLAAGVGPRRGHIKDPPGRGHFAMGAPAMPAFTVVNAGPPGSLGSRP